MSSGNRGVPPAPFPMGGWAGFPVDGRANSSGGAGAGGGVGSGSGGAGRITSGLPPQYNIPPPSLDRAFDVSGSSAGAPLVGDLKRKAPTSELPSSPEEKGSKALAPRQDISEQQQQATVRSSPPVPLAPSMGQHPRASSQEPANDSSSGGGGNSGGGSSGGGGGGSSSAPKRRRGQAKSSDNGSAKNSNNPSTTAAVALAHLLLRPGGLLHPTGAPLLQPPSASPAAPVAVNGAMLAAWLQRYWAAEQASDAAAASQAPYGRHFGSPSAALLENPLLLASSNINIGNSNGGGKGVNVDALAVASAPDAGFNDMRRGLLRGRRWLAELLLTLLPSHEAAFLQLRTCVVALLQNPNAVTCPEAEKVVALAATNPHDTAVAFPPYIFPRGTARASTSSSSSNSSSPATTAPGLPAPSALARGTSSSSPALFEGGGAMPSHTGSSLLAERAAAMPLKNTTATTKVATVNLSAESLQSSRLVQALKQVGSQRAALSSLVLDQDGADGEGNASRGSSSGEATVGRSRRVDDSVAAAAVGATLARSRLELASASANESARFAAAAQSSTAMNEDHVYACATVVNPFGASGFEADTCDAWALEPSNSSFEQSNQGSLPLLLQPSLPPSSSALPSDGSAPIPEAAVTQLCHLCFGSNCESGSSGSGQGTLLLDSSPSGGCNLVASALNAGAGYGPVLIAAPFARLQAWQDALATCAPRLKVLPYWGGSKDRATMRSFLNPSATGHEHAAWHVCLAPLDAACGDVAPTTLVENLVWSLGVIDDALPLLADARARHARATLLRATSGPNCAHGRLLVGRDLAISASALPPPGAGRRAVEALAGLVCGLHPDHHAVVRRAVGRALAKAAAAAAMHQQQQQQQQASHGSQSNHNDSHESQAVMELEGRVVPALVKLAAPQTMVYPSSNSSQSEASSGSGSGRDMPSPSLGLEESLKGWRRVAAAALALPGGEDETAQSQSTVGGAPPAGDHVRKSTSLLRTDATAVATKTICAALFGSSGQASINSSHNSSSGLPQNTAMELAKLDRGLTILRDSPLLAPQSSQHDGRASPGSVVGAKEATALSISVSSGATPAPSAQSPSDVFGFDDDFQRFHVPPPPASAPPLKSPTAAAGAASAVTMGEEDISTTSFPSSSNQPPEFLSLWSAPTEAEEDAEDCLAGDVYPYGDYLYGSAEGAARGVGVGGAGGVVLDLSGVPEHLPPMPRQRSTGPATSSRFRGVCRSKRTATDKWQAQISYGGTNYYLGLFDSEEEAGVAYARAHFKFYGPGREGFGGATTSAATASTTASTSSEAAPSAVASGAAMNPPGTPSSAAAAAAAAGLPLTSLGGSFTPMAVKSEEGSNFDDTKKSGAFSGETSAALWAGMGPPLLCSDNVAARLIEYSDAAAPEEAMHSLSSLWASDELELGCWSPAENAVDAARSKTVNSKAAMSAHRSHTDGASFTTAVGAAAVNMDLQHGGSADSSSTSGSNKQGEKKARAPRGSKQGSNKGSSSGGAASSVEDTVSLLPLKAVASKQSSSLTPESADLSSDHGRSAEVAWPYGGRLEVVDASRTPSSSEVEQEGSASSVAEVPATAAIPSALQALRSVVGQQLRSELSDAAADGATSDPGASSSACGFFKLVGRGTAPQATTAASSRGEGAATTAWSFSALAHRPTMVLGSAGGVWAKALEACMGRSSLAVPPGTSCGEVDCHLGEGLAPGPHAIVKWQPGSSGGDGGAYEVMAMGPGCALNGAALDPGQRAVLSGGCVLSFGAVAGKGKETAVGGISGATSVFVQLLLPLAAEDGQGTSISPGAAGGATTGCAMEAVVLAALRLATADSDLSPYLPVLSDAD